MSMVSVIIPTWNRAATIERAVNSVIKQTHSNLEVLVCDDGSSDDTETIIKSIQDSRVRWIPGLRSGRPSVPRNRGIRESRGEWLAFLDSDDEWLPHKIENQLQVAEKSKCQAVCSNAYRFIPQTNRSGIMLQLAAENQDGYRCFDFFNVVVDNPVICSSLLLHRSVLDRIAGFPEDRELKLGDDYALWIRTATQTSIAAVAEPLLKYLNDAADRVTDTVITNRWTIRKHVFRNFLQWAASRNVPEDYLNIARNEYYLALQKIQEAENEKTPSIAH